MESGKVALSAEVSAPTFTVMLETRDVRAHWRGSPHGPSYEAPVMAWKVWSDGRMSAMVAPIVGRFEMVEASSVKGLGDLLGIWPAGWAVGTELHGRGLATVLLPPVAKDPGDAIAYALRCLGNGNAASPMGAVEFLSTKVDEAGEAIAGAMSDLAAAVRESQARE